MIIIAINLLCIAGGLIGFISMFTPWAITSSSSFTLIDFITNNAQPGFQLGIILALMSLIFLMGVIYVFISQYGAAPLLGGAAIFLMLVELPAQISAGSIDLHAGIGPYLGILSASIVFISIIFPHGPGLENWDTIGNRGRNYTFSIYRNIQDSDGHPIWWWTVGPGWFYYWWFEMRMGWPFRDAWEKHLKKKE